MFGNHSKTICRWEHEIDTQIIVQASLVVLQNAVVIYVTYAFFSLRSRVHARTAWALKAEFSRASFKRRRPFSNLQCRSKCDRARSSRRETPHEFYVVFVARLSYRYRTIFDDIFFSIWVVLQSLWNADFEMESIADGG